jgi:hypothetical protein
VLSFDPKPIQVNSDFIVLFLLFNLDAASVHVFTTFIVRALKNLDFCFAREIGMEQGRTQITGISCIID